MSGHRTTPAPLPPAGCTKYASHVPSAVAVGDRDRVHDARQHHRDAGAQQDAELAPRHQPFGFELALVVVKMILIAHICSSVTERLYRSGGGEGFTVHGSRFRALEARRN